LKYIRFPADIETVAGGQSTFFVVLPEDLPATTDNFIGIAQMTRNFLKLVVVLALTVAFTGCTTTNGGSGSSRAEVKKVRATERLAESGLVKDEGRIKTRHDIYFNQGSDKISDEATYVVTDAVQYLLKHRRKTARIVGHTDEPGFEKDNLNLSIQRAFAVRNELIAEGIKAHRLEPIGKGEMRPIASNETADGRKKNRRVEIVFPD